MTGTEDRRTFLSALILAGGSAAAFAQSYRTPVTAGPQADGLFDYILRQITGTLRATRARGGLLRAEDATAIASWLRVCASHARGLDLDRTAQAALARTLTGSSRSALLAAPRELAALRRRLHSHGMTFDEGLVRDLALIQREPAMAALDVIETGRTTSICDRLAETLEGTSSHLARRHHAPRRVAADAWWCSFYVSQWSWHLTMAWALAIVDDPSIQQYVDVVWAGFIGYHQASSEEC